MINVKNRTSETADLFTVRNMRTYFRKGKRTVRAVDGVSFELRKGETLSIVGESGCGKTTCARTMLGLYPMREGSVLWKGKDISGLSRAEKTEFCRQNQMVFQDPYASLDPRMTVNEIISEGLRRHYSMTREERNYRVSELLRSVGLTEEYASRFPHELSGGQRQRVGIARALAVEPECLFLDEPIAALDVSIQAQIVNLLMRLQGERKLTYLMISHDLSMVRHISDRIAVMYLGEVVEIAETGALYKNPVHPYTKAFLSAIPEPDPDSGWLQKRVPLTGEIAGGAAVREGCAFANRCPCCQNDCIKCKPILEEVEPGHFAACSHVKM